MKYCPYCGNQLDDDMLFCTKCGKQYKQAVSESNQIDKADSSMPVESVQPKKGFNKRKIIIIAACAVLAVAVLLTLVFSEKEAAVIAEEEQTAAVLNFSDNPEAIQSASNSVVLLTCFDRNNEEFCTGSAFAMFEKGVFVTNYHVVDGAGAIKATTENGDEFNITGIINYSEDLDIAILSSDSTLDLETLQPGNISDLSKGSKVTAIGSPLGLINTVSSGLFSGTLRDGSEIFLQFSAAISSGSSGGALFNENGEVIGITSAGYTEGQNLNLAVPIENVTGLYESRPSKTYAFKEVYKLAGVIEGKSTEFLSKYAYRYDGSDVLVSGYIQARYYNAEKDIYRIVLNDSYSYSEHQDIKLESNYVEYKKDGKIESNSNDGWWMQVYKTSYLIVDLSSTVFGESTAERLESFLSIAELGSIVTVQGTIYYKPKTAPWVYYSFDNGLQAGITDLTGFQIN